jgi:hypothetical protein
MQTRHLQGYLRAGGGPVRPEHVQNALIAFCFFIAAAGWAIVAAYWFAFHGVFAR